VAKAPDQFDPADHFVHQCITAQFLIDDLRRVSDYVGASTVEEMEQYFWFRQHFNGGFGGATDIPKNLISGRGTNNESRSNLGFNIRSLIQDQGLGIGQGSGAWGVDLYSLRAVNVIRQKQQIRFTKADFDKKNQHPLRCEHVEEIADLRNVIRDKVLLTNELGSIQQTACFFAINHLAAVITVSEDRTSKTQSKSSDHSGRQPFRRYVKAGSVIFIDTGYDGPDSTVNVTHATKDDISRIRQNNPRWKSLLQGIQNHPGFDQSHIREQRSKFQEKTESSSYYPELTDRNLDIIRRNDPVELCREFYTWKIK
jgi:hypothetical protein